MCFLGQVPVLSLICVIEKITFHPLVQMKWYCVTEVWCYKHANSMKQQHLLPIVEFNYNHYHALFVFSYKKFIP